MNQERLIELFIKIAKIEALSTKEKPVANFIINFLSEYTLDVTEDNSSNSSNSNTGNIICKKGEGGDFLLLSHMDTARTTKNLNPVILSDRITSGGETVLGVDNRVGIAVILYTIEKLNKQKIVHKDYTAAFTTCEETTLLGSKNLEVNGSIKMGFVLDSAFRPGTFINSASGAMGFEVKIIGKATHSALDPEGGINAIEVAAKAISKIKQGRIDSDTTVNLGTIKGGSATNVIPEQVEVNGEVRSFNTNKIKIIVENIKNCFETEAEKLSGKVIFKSDWEFMPYTVLKDDDVFRETSDILKKVGLDPKPVSSLSGSDANSLNSMGIKAVNLGIGAQNPHSNDEFILLEDLYKTAEIVMELIKSN
jgi:tripeptide aminopeptidase